MSPVPAPAPVDPDGGGGGGGHPSTLYDATTDAPLLRANNNEVALGDNVDFLSHGKLDVDSGFTPDGTDEGRLATWFDPQNDAWDEGGWFAFGFPHAGDPGVVQHWGFETFEGANIRSLDSLTEFNLFARPGQTANIFQTWDENGDLAFWVPAGPVSDSVYLYSDSPVLTGVTNASFDPFGFTQFDANPRGDTIVDDGTPGFTPPAGAKIIYHSDTFEFEFLQDGYAQAQATAYPDPRADGLFNVRVGPPIVDGDTSLVLFAGGSIPLDSALSPPGQTFVLLAGGATIRVPVQAGDRWQVTAELEAASGSCNVSFADIKIYWSGV